MKNYSYEHFGRDGSYRGYKVREGNIAKYYDAQGHYKGWRDYTTGTYHDAQGHLKGRHDKRGYFYDAQGCQRD